MNPLQSPPPRVSEAIQRAVKHYLEAHYGAGSVSSIDFEAFRQPEPGRASVVVAVEFAPVRVRVRGVHTTRGRLTLTGPDWKVTRADLSDRGRTGWGPEFEVAAYSYALLRWGKGARLFVADDVMDSVLNALRKTWPTLRRAPKGWAPPPVGTVLFSLGGSYLPEPPPDFRMVTMDLAPGDSAFLEAARPRAGWTFQALKFSPGTLPAEVQVAVFAMLLARKREVARIVLASDEVRRRLRVLGYETVSQAQGRQRQKEYDRRGYYEVELKDHCWAVPTRVYIRCRTFRFPPGNDVGYENYGTVRVTRRGKGWEVLDLGDWQGE